MEKLDFVDTVEVRMQETVSHRTMGLTVALIVQLLQPLNESMNLIKSQGFLLEDIYTDLDEINDLCVEILKK